MVDLASFLLSLSFDRCVLSLGKEGAMSDHDRFNRLEKFVLRLTLFLLLLISAVKFFWFELR